MIGDYNTTETVHLPFNTFTSNDPSESSTITNLAAGDIHIHKDGSVVQRSSSVGVTISVDFDGIIGNHMAHIDLSDNTDAGFYASGSTIQVRIEGTTVDAGIINAWIGTFTIDRSLRPTVAGRTLDIQATGEVDSNLTMIGAVVQSLTDFKDFVDTGYDPATHLISEITAARMATLTDWINGGRLDLLLDAIPTTAMRGTDAAALAAEWTATRAGYIDNLSAGAVALQSLLVTVAGYLDTEIAAIKAVTDVIPDSGAMTSIAQEAGVAKEATVEEIKGTGFVESTDSNEAIRDRGDAAWVTGAGGSPPTTLQNTTIATLATQISFTLTAGSADDDAYNGCIAIVEDQSTSTQKAIGRVLNYTGATKTITLEADPGVFTMATGDTIDIVAVEKVWTASIKILTAGTNLNDISVADIIAGVADGSLDLQEMMRIILAAVAGITTNGGTRFRDSADSKNRIIAVTDASKNRTSMTLDGS